MNRWLILQFAVDIFLLLIIIFYILRDSLPKNRIPETASDVNELMPIAESLNQLTTKAEKISDRLKENIEEEKRFGEELQAIVDKKTRELNLTIQKAVSILRKLKEIQPSTDTNNGSIIDKYDEIFKLHDTGLSIKEIAEKVGASEGEVELICNLRR
ncbi:MAG: hypothetical protein A2889_05670 [Nitrospinae bacterium RIFCSPLOWO2_01_FULL_39_10]|nr:MAG: hypothetical protein A2889_05670 [Nitrospinae bacterium RIFCSPLOWO2_01_FULL_39_10]